MAVLRALEVRRVLGDRLHLVVDPTGVDGWVASELPLAKRARDSVAARRLPARVRGRWLRRVAERHPFVLPAADFPAVVPIGEHRTAGWVDDLIHHRRDEPTASLWYRDLCAAIARDGWAPSNGGDLTTPEDVERFLTGYVLPLVASLEQHGFDPDLAGEVGWAAIGPSGEVIKTKRATHRFFIARALGLPAFPLAVAFVHADWWRAVSPGAHRPDLEVAGWEDRLTDALRGVAEAHRR